MERVRRTVEMTVENREAVTVNRRHRQAVIRGCFVCGPQARMSPPEHAASLIGVSTREIYRQIENGSLHFVEPAEDALLVCIDSLREVML